MAITIGNAQSVNTPQNQTVQTLSSYVTPAGSDKILVISSSNSNNSGTSNDPTATYNGNSMTLISHVPRTWRGGLAVFYYLLGDTTPTGDIVVTWDRQANLGWAICAVTLIDAKQQAYEKLATNNTTSGTTISTDILTVTANAMIIDAVRCDVTATAFTPDGGQTEHADLGNDSNNRSALGSLLSTSITTYTVDWTAGNNDKQQIVTAWEEAAGGAGPTIIPGGLQKIGRGFSGHYAGRTGMAIE
jgi:hypothetical protein